MTFGQKKYAFGKDALLKPLPLIALLLSYLIRNFRDRSACAWTGSARQRASTQQCTRWLALLGLSFLWLFLGLANTPAFSQQIDFPHSDPTYPIHIEGSQGSRWDRGDYRVYQLSGRPTLRQGNATYTADRITLWIDRTIVPNSNDSSLVETTNSVGSFEPVTAQGEGNRQGPTPYKWIVLCEGDFIGDWGNGRKARSAQWSGRLFSFTPAEMPTIAWQQLPSETAPLIPDMEVSKNASPVSLANYQVPGNPPGLLQPAPPTTAGPTFANPNSGLSAPNTLSAPSFGGAVGSPPSAPPVLVPDPGLPATGGTNLPGGLPATGVTIETGPAMPVPTPAATAPVIGGGSLPSSPGFGVPSATPGPISAPPPMINGSMAQPFAGTTVPPSGSRSVNGPLTAKSITVRGRSTTPPQVRLSQRPDRGDSVAEITRGVYIHIADSTFTASDGSVMELGSIDIETDRAIIWMPNLSALDLSSGAADLSGQPIELYLEGNIVFRQGQRVIFAERMYYNVGQEYGMVLSAEVLTPIPEYQGLLRLKADVLQQRNRQNFLAYDAALTSSRLGVPRYWLQAQRIELEDRRPDDSGLMSGLPGFDDNKTEMMASTRNNFVYVNSVPLLYWPVMNTNLARPNFYLTGVKIKNDDIFGTQGLLDWDLYQILGLNGADGTEWTLSTDYLSERGFALGTNFNYDVPWFLVPGRAVGEFDFWGISDGGLDTLGSDRIRMTPEADKRGRFLVRHKHLLNPDTEFWAEVGYISDRNFLEQYLEQSWDQDKDYSTALRLRRYNANQMFDIWGQARINDFFTETEWLPRLDHYWLGQPIFERFTWYAHSFVGYAKQETASTPTDPQDAAKFALRPWETDSEGLVASTRQELSLPFDAGPVKLNPYISGEAGFWKEDVTQDDVSRLTGQAGVRTSLPMWQLYPNMQSRLFDIKGIAHKVILESDFFYADSTENFDRFPLYNPVDDNSQEHFRRRLIFNTFAGTLPDQFDERSYTLRNGLQRWVAAGGNEVVDDQMQWRFGIDQRWQTKRGLPGRERIVDLVEFDVDAIVFMNPDRDNFGEEVGAINYDFRYHIGDRLTLLSDGYFDTFDDGLKAYSLGAQISRVGRGELYVGAMQLQGPIDSTILTATVNYRLNEKWIVTGGTTFDFGEVGNVGQTLAFTRIGESFLIRMGINVDSGRDNVGFQFNIEPRFLPAKKLGSLAGELIPPANAFGLE